MRHCLVSWNLLSLANKKINENFHQSNNSIEAQEPKVAVGWAGGVPTSLGEHRLLKLCKLELPRGRRSYMEIFFLQWMDGGRFLPSPLEDRTNFEVHQFSSLQ